ncbi:MAG: acetyl-CoA carboxylase biotin carboxyl carrier protein [candidate division WOR-3 bacterium]|uniref:Acetyl-CoA carboxylase biotin carboxyl carrier protein n=1 Tax=candidate division WOR-3 bacterium TaxID=2052148 RepID=A0A7V4CGT2_UNCW3
MEKKKIKITDTTLRDAHQSLWATRMSIEDFSEILPKFDEAGYYSLEMWGGATFDVCIRYLLEDPWERLSFIRKQIKKTKLQMLLRGQNIVGYKNYPDDLLVAFIEKASERGIDIFRVFDALNDTRNLVKAIETVKKLNKHCQGTICYTISPVHTIEYYVKKAKEQKELGIDSICIKDMAGIISPKVAYELVKALKEELKLPVQLHTHSSSGMAVASYLKAIEAGVDIIDTAHAPLSFGTSQPAIETMLYIFEDYKIATELKKEVIREISEHFEKVRKKKNIKYEKLVDEEVLIHQIPGGMASNLYSQLKEMKAEEKLPEVLKEVPLVRRDLGYPPLVTPTSQIVGVQAVFNVISGERYKIIPKEVKDYVKGLYGAPPAPIEEKLIKKILGDEKPIACRPADLLSPILDKVKKELSPELIEKEEDYITYALFPEIALKFFEKRKNREKFKEEKMEQKSANGNDKKDIKYLEELLNLLSKFKFSEIKLDLGEIKIELKTYPTQITPQLSVSKPEEEKTTISLTSETTTAQKEEKELTTIEEEKYEKITSPMVGTFYRRPKPDAPPFCEKGDIVEKGATLCIIEAMKLMNEIKAEKKSKIIDILVEDGSPVEYGQPLFLIEEVA